MSFLQRMAMKKFESMSDDERRKVMQKAMSPESMEKNKYKILASLKMMRKTGQISADQYEMAKQKMGIREK